MTKGKARAIDRTLNVQCDEPYMFVTKVGTGCLVSSKIRGDNVVIFTLIVNLIDSIMQNLQQHYHHKFVEILCLKFLQYLTDDEAPPKPQEQLTGKLLAKRIKHNELILNALEDVL